MSTTLTPEAFSSVAPSRYDANVDQHLREVIAVHLDPKHGSLYWLQRQDELGFDVRDQIRGMSDLPKLGLVESRTLAGRSVWDFVPCSVASQRRDFITAETGGTTGPPAPVVYLEHEFRRAFVDPFVSVAQHLQFPCESEWLFIGPSGPHIIGKAARHLASRMKSPDPWAVDFDPRWAKKLIPGSMSATRYLDHVVQQAIAILSREKIGVLFATPPVLHRLVADASDAQRDTIKAVHYGGIALTASELNHFREAYPNAVHFSGYGNSLFGCALEVQDRHRTNLDYFPQGSRLAFQVKPADCSEATSEVGAHGQLVFHRIDHSMLLLGVLERDQAELIAPSWAARQVGCKAAGIRDPGPLVNRTSDLKIGIY